LILKNFFILKILRDSSLAGKHFLFSRTFVRYPFCNLSTKGIFTVALPNRLADNKAGGSGSVGQWATGRATVVVWLHHGRFKVKYDVRC
jgi:hypothetical protein